MVLNPTARKMASKASIFRYWCIDGSGLSIFKSKGIEAYPDSCFACGDGVYLERAHIQPHCEGGSGLVDNLHMLCKACHFESEYFEGDRYWQWLTYKNQNEYKPAYEHTLQRMKRLGFTLDDLINVYNHHGQDAALQYARQFTVSGT